MSRHAIPRRSRLCAAQYDKAFLSYQKALTLKPDLDNVEGLRLLAKLHLCDWTDLELETAQLLSRLREGKAVSAPFPLLTLPSTASDRLQSAKRYAKGQPVHPGLWPYSHDRIRVAYLSANFCNHAVAHLTAGLFENHDRSQFEITGLSIGRSDDSAMRGRLEKAFEHFIDLSDKTDMKVAQLIRDREVHILINLMGYTQRSRLGVWVRRPAPIQVHYLGYAGTLGTNYIDYFIADATVIPEEHREFYREQVVWLPDSYLASDNLRAISPDTPTRKECGLPENGFVFCSFNNS
jgi:protein O-GlcNAc transferase